ncbi:MAG: hypothetical protein WD607_10605, partial [Candidatus Paceibacterota bacterium]
TISQKKSEFNDDDSSEPSIEYDWKSPKNILKPSNSLSFEYEYDDDPFQPGIAVMHSQFGTGKILQRTGSGKDSRVTVFFKDRGQKTLMLRAANLKPIL